MTQPSKRLSIALAVCTYKRNHDLAVLLRALVVCADRIKDRAAVGVAIVDDTAAGEAREVAEGTADQFELGLQYRISGKQNISMARNIAIETAMDMADLTVMTDDDCEPPAEWLEVLLDSWQATGADAVTGRMVRRVPPGSPRWLTEEPFLELGVEDPDDGAVMEAAATFNTMMSSEWLKRHPHIRFDPAFGVIGGEDMVFFRSARAEGLTIRFAEKAFVYENEPPARANLVYQLYIYFWHGNSACLSSIEKGSPRWRMLIHSGTSFLRAVARPIGRLFRGQKPQLRFCAAMILHALGKFVGVFGLRINHR
jgi:succinoglycan biosynthesis protein ExoM